MESNKLLIGIEFIDSRHNNENPVIELIVPRDLTVRQLLDGIRYGLRKKEGEAFYRACLEIYHECIDARSADGIYRRICLTSYNRALMTEKINGRAVLRETDMQKTLAQAGIISSTKVVFDPTESYESVEINTSDMIPAFNPSPERKGEIQYPSYNISSRQLYRFDDTPVELIPAADPPTKPDQNLLFMLLPTLLMVIVIIGSRTATNGVSQSTISMIVFSASMSVVTIATSIINWVRQKKRYKESLEKWRHEYETYVDKTIGDIVARQEKDTQQLNRLYPDIVELINEKNTEKNIYTLCGDIFSRCSEDLDYLSVRLGISDMVDSRFEIRGSRKDVIFSSTGFKIKFDKVKVYISDDPEYDNKEDKTFYLSNLPSYIATRYRCMKRAPLLFSLKDCATLGLVSDHPLFSKRLIQKMIFDLCFYHSPDELQFVILFEPAEDLRKIEECVEIYKFLPHFRGLFPDHAQFVFDEHSANAVFSNMLSIMSERAAASGQGVHYSHIVFIVEHEYDLKEHAFAQYLPKLPPDGKPYQNDLGITFLFSKKYKEYLPQYCSQVIYLQDDHTAELIPHEDYEKRRTFNFSLPPDWYTHLHNTSRILSSLCYSRISENGKVPSAVSLFELYGFTKGNIRIADFWEDTPNGQRSNVIDSLSVPIGKTESGITCLDLHEDFDGPHMLVAGTTGSGKSETIITYLLGLCLYFRPDEVNLMLVDMKGGGFIKRIGTLPHVVGSVTDVDGDENGTGAEYMLKRFLNALQSEIKRRKILFNSMHVDSINQYIKACRDIDAHIMNINNRLAGEDKEPLEEAEEQALRQQAAANPLAHLILVVDEFTELKRFSTESNDVDFIGEITTIARVGRSLGFHIILISQNIEGAITDDIRVNSKSRLCLKVATRQASKEMIGNDLAASPTMPGHGRAYLLVGTGSKFEYFQSGYAGAVAEENFELPVEITEASKSGAYTAFYRSEKDNIEVIRRKKELETQGKLETQLNAVVGAIKTYYNRNRDKHPQPHIVFQKPLPQNIVYEDGRIYEERDGRYELIKELQE